ncbi:hypothetical protein [Nitratireductor luteus]|uniref:hypothetical protein n=1 Tax=Nitratireductor luteus TaxID=2976980 RepID=UPI002240E218|nr:hypothetical protein [Nitratireductor luteus]
MTEVLSRIHDGMRIIDATGEEIGTVETVHMPEGDLSNPQAETLTAGPNPGQFASTLTASLARAFTTDHVPEVLQKRLLREGFVRVDVDGLLAADRYVLPEQIDSVAGDAVHLTASLEELIRRS